MEELFRHTGVTISLLLEQSEQSKLLTLFRAVASEQGWRTGADLQEPHMCSIYLSALVSDVLAGGIELRMPDAARFLPIAVTWPEAGSIRHAQFDAPGEHI